MSLVALVLLITAVSAFKDHTGFNLASERKVNITFVAVEEKDIVGELKIEYTDESIYEDRIEIHSRSRRQSSSGQCTDDPTTSITVTLKETGQQIKNVSCVGFFLRTGIGFCGHKELEKRCCATRHRHCELCPDFPGTLVNGYTCDEFFQLTGSQSCAIDKLRQHCCGSRRRYCETCYQDTTGIRINDMTCKEVLSKSDKAQLCDHHLIKQHCCASVAHYCPCKADVPGALFFHGNAKGNLANCASIFTVGNLVDTCKHPNAWEKCCKTRQHYCETPPETSLIGR